MKIAQIVCTFPPYPGGIGNVAFDYAQAVKNSGHEVTVFTPDYDGKKINNDILVFYLKPFFKAGNAAFIPQLFLHIIRGNFDIVHLHYPFFGVMEIVWLAKKLFKKKFKLVIHYHMNVVGLPWYLEILRLPSRLINKSLFNIADAITCASIDYIKNNDTGHILSKNKEKFFEIPFGVDTKIFKPNGNKKKQILFVGGMDKAHYFKGVSILLRAFSRLKNNDFSLVLVGNGNLLDSYKKQAEKLKISNRVKFSTGINKENLIKIYQESSVLVLPSVNNCEAFGIVLIEAMACGTPVVASSLPGVRTVFEDKVQGYYTTPADTNDLIEKLNVIITSNSSRQLMGVAARELALLKYDLNKINNELISFYKKLI